MSTITSGTERSSQDLIRQQVSRIGPLGAIILLHVVFFYVLQSGLLHQVADALPKEVFATFVTPQQAPEPVSKPEPVTPKTVPVVKHAVTAPHVTPIAPAINKAPPEQAITAPASTAPPPPAATPASTAVAQPKTITSGVEYIEQPQPDYPVVSRRMGEEGKVVLLVLVNEKGRAERVDIQKSSGSTRLDEAARKAVLRALFKPHMEDGKAIAVLVPVPINFNLNN